MAFGGMGFKIRIKLFNSEAQGTKWQYKSCDSKCHSVAWGSKWQYKACDSKCHSVAWGSKCKLNCSIVKHTQTELAETLYHCCSSQLTQKLVLGFDFSE
jgi:hypothetical protein